MRRNVTVLILLAILVVSAAQAADPSLAGLWKATRRFGPDARGPLVLFRRAGDWIADLDGQQLPMRVEGKELSFALPGDAGAFRARLDGDAAAIRGHWITPPSETSGSRYAAPVTLVRDRAGRYRGTVTLRDDTFTIYLSVSARPDGTLGAFLVNPDRNVGVNLAVDHLERSGDVVTLVGKRNGRGADQVLVRGSYDADAEMMTFAIRGASYDFRRDGEASGFYARGRGAERYRYAPPLARDDGWPVATVDAANVSRAGIEAFVQRLIDAPVSSVHAPQVHALLVARHGRLIVEEYFHGERRDHLHDTRSAAKSVTATVIGAAIQAGAPLALDSPVYRVMNGGEFPPGLDERKRAMTVEHLLMMRSGFFCDDANSDAPGNEENILEQTADPDYWHYSLAVPMAMRPDSASIYCSMNPNLALGVLARATGEWPVVTFDRLVARPMRIATYAWPLDPAGNPYGGGAALFTARDFLKFAQLMLNGGTWGGRRILSRDFVARASAPRHDLAGIQYGYLWWSMEMPYKSRTVRAYFASGNGGQTAMAIPELGLAVGIYAGNYADHVAVDIQQNYVANYLLPAIREAGDDPNAPIVEGHFATPYPKPVPNPR